MIELTAVELLDRYLDDGVEPGRAIAYVMRDLRARTRARRS